MSDTGGSFGGKTKFQPGGTPGGGGSFFAGLVMMGVGIYMVFDRVTVHTSFWRFFGGAQTSFGVTLLPLLAGVGFLAFNGKSFLGWLLAGGGVVLILVGRAHEPRHLLSAHQPVRDDRHVRSHRRRIGPVRQGTPPPPKQLSSGIMVRWGCSGPLGRNRRYARCIA